MPRLALVCLAVLAPAAVAETHAQTVHVSISTRSTAGFAQPKVKVQIGSHSLTTDASGLGSVDLAAGTYKVKAVTKCRVESVTTSRNINMEEVGGTSTEPEIRLRAPQEWPVGIQFELDCKKAVRKKPSSSDK